MGKTSKKSGKRSRRAQSSNRKGIRSRRDYRKALLAVGVLLAILVRYPLLPFESRDYITALRPWYQFIASNGNFAALKYKASVYNPYNVPVYNVPYLYLLATASVLLSGIPDIFAIKIISIIFDFLLAFFAYQCVRLRYRESSEGAMPILAGLVTLFMPTVVLNSAMWGQADAICTAFLVACLYYLLAGRQVAAFVAFGVAFAFKAQAVFLAPFLFFLWVKREVHWWHFSIIPAVYLVAILPAWVIGRPLYDLLLIYPSQTDNYRELSMNAPNLYAWISNDYYEFYPIGVAFAAVVVLVIAAFVYKSRVKMTADRLVFLATFSALLTPYILPKMHERYFFSAEVIGIILAFYCPRYWYVPVVVGSVSLAVYVSYLSNPLAPITFLPGLAAVLLVLIAVLGRQFLLMFSDKHRLGREG